MKGLVLAGGTGSRLWPITWGVSKQLLPVYDKPLVHYPISTLMLAGIREILIITTPQDLASFRRLLGNGSMYGVQFRFQVQEKPEGLAQAFTIGEKFIGTDKCALILGDNLFYGANLGTTLSKLHDVEGAHIFAYKVSDPERYGVIEFRNDGEALSIEEKPRIPKSPYAVPGLYFYDNEVVAIAKSIAPSVRGELEITAVNQVFLDQRRLKVSVLDRGTAWLDTGTFQSLSAASNFVQIIEERQGQKIACLEEIAWRNKWITDENLMQLSANYANSPFGSYLSSLLK